MPSAQDNLGKIVQYTGATTATYQNACFYKAVYDSEHDTYVWTIVKFSADISVDNVLSDVSENPVQNKVITNKFGEYKTAFTGTEEEWNALTSEEQNVYDIMNITNDGDVLNLGIYLEKKTIMPVASEDVENRIYLYTGTTTQNYKKGVVYQCVSDGQNPATYSWVALIDFGTAAIKNSTDRVSPNNTDLVESQSVYSAINTALSSIYSPRGEITCAELTSSLLISDNIGNVYETSDSGTTTALFLQGAGVPISAGTNVGIINAGEGRILFNLMANAFDLTAYQKKDLDTPLTIGGTSQTTVEGALGALNTAKVDLSTLGRFKTFTVTLSPSTQRTISFSNVAKRVRIDIDSTGANNNTQFHGVLVGYNEMTSNRLIGLYKRGTNGLLVSLGSYELTIANPSTTATDTVIFTFYNLAGNITTTISDESAITLTEMGDGWQELVTKSNLTCDLLCDSFSNGSGDLPSNVADYRLFIVCATAGSAVKEIAIVNRQLGVNGMNCDMIGHEGAGQITSEQALTYVTYGTVTINTLTKKATYTCDAYTSPLFQFGINAIYGIK